MQSIVHRNSHPIYLTGVSNHLPLQCCPWLPWEAGCFGLTLAPMAQCAPNVINLGSQSLYCIASWILSATELGSRDSDEQVFHKQTLVVLYLNICHVYDHGNISFGHRWRRAMVSYNFLAPSNNREAVGAYHGNTTNLHKFVGAHDLVTCNL